MLEAFSKRNIFVDVGKNGSLTLTFWFYGAQGETLKYVYTLQEVKGLSLIHI